MTKPVTRKLAVDCLLDRANRAGQPIICTECGEPCLPGQQIQFDHIFGDKMGGAHEYLNLRPIHYDPCHKAKSARDVAALAKVDRITGITKGPPKKAWAKGPKLQSRPFPTKKAPGVTRGLKLRG